MFRIFARLGLRRNLALVMPITALVFSYFQGALAQDCAAILPYIQTSSDVNSVKYSKQRLANWLLSDTHSSYSDAYNSALSLKLPIDGIPLEIGGTSRDTNWSDYRQKLAQLILNESLATEEQKTSIHGVMQAGVEAWRDCIESKGLHFWNRSALDDSTVVVSARYNSSYYTRPSTKITALQWTPDDILNCPKHDKRTALGSSDKIWSCQRNRNDAVTVTLSTSTAGSVSIHIPAFVVCSESSQTKTEGCGEGFDGNRILTRQVCLRGVNGTSSDWSVLANDCKSSSCRYAPTIVKELTDGLWGPGKLSNKEKDEFVDGLKNTSYSVKGLARHLVTDKRFLDSVGKYMCDCHAGNPGYVGNHTQLLLATYDLIEKSYRKVLHKNAPTWESNPGFYAGNADSFFDWINNGILVNQDRLGRLASHWIDSKEWSDRFGENGVATNNDDTIVRYCGQ